MTSKFLTALSFTLQQEGGYANVEGDSGGETYRGVSRNNWPEWEGWALVDKSREDSSFPHNLGAVLSLQDEVHTFYQKHYWCPNYDKINSQGICTFVFDLGVNAGIKEAAIITQRAVNSLQFPISEDGVFGSQTLYAVNCIYPADLLAAFKNCATSFYKTVALKNPLDRKFLSNWLSRVNAHTL